MERAGEKEVWAVGAWPPFTQELQLSSGSHFWSWLELSFRDACAQPVPSWSRPWHDLQPNSSQQTCLAPLGCGWPCTRLTPDHGTCSLLLAWVPRDCALSARWFPPPALPITFHPCLAFPVEQLALAAPWLLGVGICTRDMQEHHSIAYNVDAELNEGMISETHSDSFSNAHKIWLCGRVNVSKSVSRSWKLLFKN